MAVFHESLADEFGGDKHAGKADLVTGPGGSRRGFLRSSRYMKNKRQQKWRTAFRRMNHE
jgi:hypothetical protein